MGRENWTSEKIFERLIKNKTKATFWENVHELRKRPSEEVYNRAYELAGSNNDKLAIIGVYVLAQLGPMPRLHPQKTVKLYFELLKNENSSELLAAILSSIGHNNSQLSAHQVSLLAKYKWHNDNEVRFELSMALAGLEYAEAIETLIILTKDKDADIRDWATFNLGTQIAVDSEDIRAALWSRIEDKDQITRFEAYLGLSKRKDPRIKDILVNELANIDDSKNIILECIELLNDKAFIPILEKKIIDNKESKQVDQDLLKTTLKALKEIRE